MKHITFLGAAGTVTGSSYFLKDNTGNGILIDMGMFQGSQEIEEYNNESIPLHPKRILAVVLTHAHLDHCGRLPLLRRLGYSGSIYMTAATKSLVELALLDAVHVARNREHGRLLYNEEDVRWTLGHTKTIAYHETVSIGPFSIELKDAGHILGSSLVTVHCRKNRDGIENIVFSGDIGNYPEELVRTTEIVRNADIVVMESTYGDRAHTKEIPEDVLAEEIQTIQETKGTLLIPAFSIERSQELLYIIDRLKKNGRVKEETMVFLDSVLAIHVTRVYQQYRSLYNEEVINHALSDDPFLFPGLHMIERHDESMNIDAFPGPKVIIAGSGMMTGGRILRHAKRYLPLPSTRLLIVGYQAEGTLGRALLEGAKTVNIDNISVPVRAHIRKSSGLSSHADQPKLLGWLSSIKGVSFVCLTHGEDPQRTALAGEIHKKWPNIAVYKPQKGETVTFGQNQEIRYYGSSSNKRR